MTCIVGLEDQGRVIIGADSASVSGYQTTVTRLKKVFKTGPFVIGYTSSFRMGQLLQYNLHVREQYASEDDLAFMVTAFAEAVRTCLKDGGYARVESNAESGGAFLVGYRGNLYRVADDFQVNSAAQGYDAVGCGDDYAMGALYACRGVEMPAENRVLAALQAADNFSGWVCRPFAIEILE